MLVILFLPGGIVGLVPNVARQAGRSDSEVAERRQSGATCEYLKAKA